MGNTVTKPEYCTCKTCSGVSTQREAVTWCHNCDTSFCLDCVTNHNRGGGDGGKQVPHEPIPTDYVECPVCDKAIPAPELYTDAYWEAIGITNYDGRCMVVGCSSQAAQIHWK